MVRGMLTVAGSGLLEDKVLIKYVKSLSVQLQFTAIQSNLIPYCTDYSLLSWNCCYNENISSLWNKAWILSESVKFTGGKKLNQCDSV